MIACDRNHISLLPPDKPRRTIRICGNAWYVRNSAHFLYTSAMLIRSLTDVPGSLRAVTPSARVNSISSKASSKRCASFRVGTSSSWYGIERKGPRSSCYS